MKKSTIINTLIAVLMFSQSCTDTFDELNIAEDKLTTDQVDVALLNQTFAYAQYNAMGIFGYSYLWHSVLYSDRFAQYHSNFHPAFNSGQYEASGTHVGSIWSRFYSSVPPALDFIDKYTQENNLPVENAIAKIWRVESFHKITDEFGPIIYSHFGSGETSVPYDSQEDIYSNFFEQLDEAVSILKENPGKNVFGSNDQMYGGNVDKWLLYANSLRLRLAMRIVYANPELAKQEAEKAVEDGVILKNEDNAEIFTTENSRNGLSTVTYHEEWRMSATLYSLLAGYNDPRLTEYLAPRWDGNGYIGLRNGLPIDQRDPSVIETVSSIGNRWRPLFSGAWGEAGTSEPMPVILASEVAFLMAEGKLRGWNMGSLSTEELYNEGIRLSLSDMTNVSNQEIEDYINSTDIPIAIDDNWNSPPVTDIPVLYQNASDFETQLEQIITQKWLALFPNGYEAWAERRRTGYPVGYAIIESLNPNLSKFDLMRRLQFSPTEESENATALEEAKKLLNGPDNNATRVWWDAKPLSDYKTPTN